MVTHGSTPAQPVPADLSRRDFLKSSAVVAAATLAGGCATTGAQLGVAPRHIEKQPDRIRVGVIGCGGRGTGAATDCVNAAPNVQIVALGDLFADHLKSSRDHLASLGEKCQVTDDRCFVGFDAYKGVLACDIDLVILATPPGFRPQHLMAAIVAGKHVFMEKPVAVDAVGVRTVIAASELAAARKLAIVAGTQRRHQPSYLEAMKRVQDGKVGEILSAQCYWNQGDLWVKPREPGWSDMEWQCRNWLYFTWLSGDHIVEQHVHNLDVVNWALGGPPARCMGMGGRQVRTAPEYGNIFDHFSVEYEYAGGVRTLSMCRQTKGARDIVCERIVGTKGRLYTDGGSHARIDSRAGKKVWEYEAPPGSEQNPYVLEHRDLIAGIRAGKPLNEGRRIAESTLTAIMGRMSAYTGREVSWEWVMSTSKLDLTPSSFAMGDLAIEPVPVPGQTPLV
jgi:predicted dehydrogenase